MSEKNSFSKKYIKSQIDQIENKKYQNTVRQLCDTLGEENVFKIMTKHNIHLNTQDSATRQKIVSLLTEWLHTKEDIEVKSINGTHVGSYIYNLFVKKIITKQNMPTFLRENERYFDEICYQINGLGQRYDNRAGYSDKLLVDAIWDPILEAKLLSFPDRYNKHKRDKEEFDSFYGLLITAYLHNQQPQKAINIYKKSWQSGERWFLFRLIDKGYIDMATNFVMNQADFKKKFNGSKNWNYKSLSDLFTHLLKVDTQKAIDFIIDPKITEIWYHDMEHFMTAMAKNSVSDDLILKFFGSQTVYNKSWNIWPIAGLFEEFGKKLGKKRGPELIKKIFIANNNQRSKIILGWGIDAKTSTKEIYDRIDKTYARYLTACVDL